MMFFRRPWTVEYQEIPDEVFAEFAKKIATVMPPDTIIVHPTTYKMIKSRAAEASGGAQALIESVSWPSKSVPALARLAKIHDSIGDDVGEGSKGSVYIIAYTSGPTRAIGHYVLVRVELTENSLTADVYDTAMSSQVKSSLNSEDRAVIGDIRSYLQWKTGRNVEKPALVEHRVRQQAGAYECGVLVMVHLYAAITGKSTMEVNADSEFVEEARAVIEGVVKGFPIDTMDSLF